MKTLDVKEFVDFGYLQEVNRLFFHRCGLALSVSISEYGAYALNNIQDSRDDPEGFLFWPEDIDATKARNVEQAMFEKLSARLKIGDCGIDGVQKIPSKSKGESQNHKEERH